MDKITFAAGKENIIGEILGKDEGKLSNFIYFHGAGRSAKERAKEFFDESLFNTVPSIVTFDFSGHGERTGELKHSSLKQRAHEAQTAIELYTTKKQLTVCGSSMGGYIALKMLSLYDIKNVILFAPALYDKQAFEVPFNQGFSEIIRRPNSWGESDVLSSLEKFSGSLLLYIGKQDKVIPHGVIDLIDKHSTNTQRKEIIRLDDCDHAITTWLNNHSDERRQITEKISRYYLT